MPPPGLPPPGLPPPLEGAACTTAVGADAAGLLDAPFWDPVSWTATVCPTSADASLYVCAVAPGIGEQPAPEVSHDSH